MQRRIGVQRPRPPYHRRSSSSAEVEKSSGGQQSFLTTMTITTGEYHLLTKLPATALCKTRWSLPPFGIAVFEGDLKGLMLAEAEFNSADSADALLWRELTPR